MNKNASVFIRLVTVSLVLVMLLSAISCDSLNLDSLFGNGPVETPNETCKHENVTDGICDDCHESFFVKVSDLNLNALFGSLAPEGSTSSRVFYTEATVSDLLNDTTGAMVIEDESGSIKVQALSDKDGKSYSEMTEKPDECDVIKIACTLIKADGVWQIKEATLISFEAVEAPIKILTVAEALELCGEPGNLTTERYYVRGTVKTVTNPAYGAMIIYDETGEISVYGTYSEDGSIGYADMEERPVKGDEVLLYCTLQNYNGDKEIKNARLIEFTHVDVPFDESNYTSMTIAEAREADIGTLVKVSGVVARITFANGYKPSGVILVDGTSSIYVYDQDIAGQVEIGNTITLAAEKTYWILDTEASSAEKFGYKGANQLDSAILISNDKGNTAFDKSWITETTVKDIMDTPVTEDITSKIFKATALVKKAPGNGFINYYIDDLDGATGSYVYTQCNGGDFEWLDQFDGKFCTVYFVAINAKSTSTGCTWRFLPIEVIDEGYTFDTNGAAKYAVKYHGVGQFLTAYTGDPAAELLSSISSELLGFEGATLSYSSSDETVVYFTTDENGVVTFHCGKSGSATVTITGTYGENTYSETVEISVEANEEIEYITVADAIASADDTIVTVKGIVGPSVVNRNAFYFFGEDGSVITVLVNDVEIFDEIKIGHEIVITGKREHFVDESKYNGNYVGQATIVEAEIVANYYGNHEYSTEKFVTDKTVEDLRNLDIMVDYSTTVFVVDTIVDVQETAYYTNIKLLSTDGSVNITLYCSSANQYSWLKTYAGQTVTLELAACNWNNKTYWTFCALALVNEDGTKVLNTLNWN